ncbi:DUF4349 domain-containing protein [Hymenobacter rubripertinctus]|uniref:DUF4349 domain-containing protein n=1 Tax=Hymenobacter rubripertinctus TaxID=2029981 RepID=A0A418R758_9BACT|nr:DUF4349 domain-containing protein [Hymenobacter rubripertinctus]RIY13317.1 DUF4349 domain-containing protein [Hymenobacter rubripertinctus]
MRILLKLVLAVALLGCGQAKQGEMSVEESSADSSSMDGSSEEESAADGSSVDKDISTKALQEAPAPPPGSDQSAEPSAVAPAASRKLIYHATVRVKVADLPRANQRMDSLTQALGAYVEAASEVREDNEWRHEMKIRVAPARFQAILSGLGRLGTLESREQTTDDVTAQHADVTARLASKRALEQRYLELLKKANKVADMLEIEQKVGEIREEIEATQSRLRSLNDEVGYSTITFTYYQLLSQPRPDAPLLSFGSRLLESFYSGWELLTHLVLGLVAGWPLLLLLAVAVASLRAWRRRAGQRKA